MYKDVNILVTLTALPPTLEDAPALTHIHFVSSGTNQIVNHPIYTSSNIPLTTSRGVAGPPIAEWVIMTALVHNHRYNNIRDLQLKSQWGTQADFWSANDVVGQRIGILGYGGIGRHGGFFVARDSDSSTDMAFSRASRKGHGNGGLRFHRLAQNHTRAAPR